MHLRYFLLLLINLDRMDLKDSSKVRFELKSQVLWKNKTVLGTTDSFSIGHLLKMQSQAGEDRDARKIPRPPSPLVITL